LDLPARFWWADVIVELTIRESIVPAVLKVWNGAILEVTLNRPDRLNAVSEDLYSELIEAMEEAGDHADARAVLVTGSGRAFCAGADLKAHAEGRSKAERKNYVALGSRACRAIQTCPLPVVSAVHGYAIGAGAELALSCDLMVMEKTAKLSFPESSLSTYVGGGITWKLPRVVGIQRAAALLMLGEMIDGSDAERFGLAIECVDTGEAHARASLLAQRLAKQGPLSLRALKVDLSEGSTRTLAQAVEVEERVLLGLMDTEDWAEGLAAAGDRRVPNYVGA